MAILTCGRPMTDGCKSCAGIRLGKSTRLIMGLWLLLTACVFREDKSPDKAGLSLIWEEQKAVGISIPRYLTHHLPDDSVGRRLSVRLAGTDQPASMLGTYEFREATILFRPLIPFTPGLGYDIFLDTVFMGGVVIPQSASLEKPVLLSVYPTADTLPENLLKMYLQFSKPMRAGKSLQHISFIDAHNDTLPAPFLDLQPELWNQEGTRLTLWLDPGRIKKDLQPNKALGPPLAAGETITLTVSTAWQDQDGLPLEQAYSRHFYITASDRKSPAPHTWHLSLPKAGTRQPLEISFGEPLDEALLQETITIREKDEQVNGSISVEKGERKLYFTPHVTWKKSNYRVQVEARLEDLAGNNLNRPFEIDKENYQPIDEQEFFTVKFEVR